MEIDPHRCYRALRSRDARFDGRFFAAVRTTGVYCRPVCPARTPKRENVVFFACAAAAEDAGFRPCRRCRPETSPGTPAWLGSSAVVGRALRLIESGALDDANVAELAARVGVGDRQLRRLFASHLGTSPLAVARTQRAHLARRLLDETDLRATDVAFAAGYGSVRRFNEALRETFGASPSALRRRPLGKPRAGDLQLRLPYREPYAAAALFSFLATRALPGVESASAAAYRRVVVATGGHALVDVRPLPDRPALILRVRSDDVRGLADIVARARRVFDVGADPHAVDSELGADPALAALVRRRPGLRLPGTWSFFELAARAVLGQQVSVAAATTLAARLVERCGERLGHYDDVDRAFPSAQAVRAADLDGLGITSARVATLRALAAAVDDGRVGGDDRGDLDDEIARLTAIPGIGPWTAHYIAMRGLGEVDAFPAADLVVRRMLGNGRPLSAAECERRADRWRPWRAYAVMHLWNGANDLRAKEAR